MKSKIIQITAGRGPAECSWVVAKVLKVFLEEAKTIGLSYDILQREKGTENGTIQSVTISLKGNTLESFLGSWLGSIKWVGNSTFRKYHKRKNWFIGVFELDQIKNISLNLNEISYQAMRSTGPGGQNVNKVNSAVRAIHNPTGIQVVAMDSRSQHQNKKLALTRLKEKLNLNNLEQLKDSITDQWENHLNLERGNPIRVFKGSQFKNDKTTKSYKPKRQKLKNDLKQQKWD